MGKEIGEEWTERKRNREGEKEWEGMTEGKGGSEGKGRKGKGKQTYNFTTAPLHMPRINFVGIRFEFIRG